MNNFDLIYVGEWLKSVSYLCIHLTTHLDKILTDNIFRSIINKSSRA